MLRSYFFVLNVIAGLHDKRKSEEGATATEYGLLVGLIALAIGVAVTVFEDALSGFFTDLGGIVDGWTATV